MADESKLNKVEPAGETSEPGVTEGPTGGQSGATSKEGEIDVVEALPDEGATSLHQGIKAPAGGEPEQDGAADLADTPGESEPVSAPTEAQPAKRSPTEAFRELRDVVDEVGTFVRVCKEKLIRDADEHRLKGMQAVLETLMLLHGIIFRQVTSMEAGSSRPDQFTINLFETLEAELEGHGVEVIRAHPGDDVDLEVMTTIGAAKCPFWRKPGRVAQVASCGFALGNGTGRRILRKAKVTVYR